MVVVVVVVVVVAWEAEGEDEGLGWLDAEADAAALAAASASAAAWRSGVLNIQGVETGNREGEGSWGEVGVGRGWVRVHCSERRLHGSKGDGGARAHLVGPSGRPLYWAWSS